MIDDGFLPDAHQSPPTRRGCVSVLPFLILFLASLAPAPSGALNDPVLPPAVHSVSRGAPVCGRETGGWTTGAGQTRALDAAAPSPGWVSQSPGDERLATCGSEAARLNHRPKAVARRVMVPAVIADATGGTPRDASSWGAPPYWLAAALPSAGTPASVPATSYRASASWCAPTPTQCQSWGPPAKLAAVHSFRFGDEPYWVRVWRGSAFVDVKVVSFCQCNGREDAIDLSPAAFEKLAPLSRGRVWVTVTDLEAGNEPLPATDSEGE